MRGTGVPTDSALLARIQAIENLLGISDGVIGNASLFVMDTNGMVRIRLGNQGNGDYTLSTIDPAGVRTEVWPISSAFKQNVGSRASVTPGVIAGSPSVTCWLGSSGDCLVTVSCDVQNTGAGDTDTGYLTLAVDSSEFTPGTPMLIGSPGNANGGSFSATVQLSKVLGSTVPVSPNSEHTFSFLFSNVTGTCSFYNMSVIVQPI
jgi:hypothetical protein